MPSESVLFPDPEEVEELVVGQIANSALFASHFRENAARALLLPRRRPGARSPLWAQRQRSANLLAVASRYGSFPIILETYRECLRDVFDLPGLVDILSSIRSRAIRVHSVETQQSSPFSRSLLFDYVAAYMYEGDAPLAERRAHALALDRNLLRDLLGDDELRELLDPAAIDDTELELQALSDGRKVRNADQLHDLLRRIGELTELEVSHRLSEPPRALEWLALLQESHRACRLRIAGEERWIAIEDAGRYRDALGVATPLGVPEVFLKPTEDALDGLVARYGRTHAPFLATAPASRWSLPEGLIVDALRRLESVGAILHGDFRPGGREREWCDPEVLRTLRRRSLARLRREVEAVDASAFTRFQLRWHGIGSPLAGIDRLRESLTQLEGLPLPASVLERDVLPARVTDYQPRMLDELCATGEFTWLGRGPLGRDDGRVAFFRRDQVPKLIASSPAEIPGEELHQTIIETLRNRGASFFSDIVVASRAHPREVLPALWDLAWAGIVTNDTFAPVRALAWPKRGTGSARGRGGLPPESSGRWSLALAPEATEDATATVRAHALSLALLERYGVVTREGVASEGIPGSFSAVYPVLKAMEESGRIRRGYFVDGLGAAQFALPGAVDRLRAERDAPDEPTVHVVAATDPVNPYGAALAWPRRVEGDRRGLQRTAGAYVVIVNGAAALYLERGGRGIVTFPLMDTPATAAVALGCLLQFAAQQPSGSLTIERVDGVPVGEAGLKDALLGAGFVPGYRGLTYRPPRREVAGARGR
jgi:ATP-dependent helicase Lhr and Lhr-like helicase